MRKHPHPSNACRLDKMSSTSELESLYIFPSKTIIALSFRQVNSAKYRNLGTGFKVTIAEEGVLRLTRGWLPTFLGYSTQGLFKFGLYEFFKVYYTKLVGDDIAFDYRTWLYLMSSASAEFFADIGLAPMEAVKVLLNPT